MLNKINWNADSSYFNQEIIYTSIVDSTLEMTPPILEHQQYPPPYLLLIYTNKNPWLNIQTDLIYKRINSYPRKPLYFNTPKHITWVESSSKSLYQELSDIKTELFVMKSFAIDQTYMVRRKIWNIYSWIIKMCDSEEVHLGILYRNKKRCVKQLK